MASKNERGFDIKGGAVWFRRGRMRSVGQGGLFGQVQGAGFGVGVDVKLLRGRTKGGGERGRAVAGAAGRGGRTRRHGLGGGSDGTHTRWCSGVEMVVRERVRGRGRGGRRGGRRGVRGGQPLLLGGGVGITGVRPIGGGVIGAAMIKI